MTDAAAVAQGRDVLAVKNNEPLWADTEPQVAARRLAEEIPDDGTRNV